MPTWLNIFDSGQWRPREWRCSFCHTRHGSIQPVDVVRKGRTPRQGKPHLLCCPKCWKSVDLVVYAP